MNFQQHKTQLYKWTWWNGQYQIQTDIFFAAKDQETLYSQQKQDLELTAAKFMSSLLQNSRLTWSRENH